MGKDFYTKWMEAICRVALGEPPECIFNKDKDNIKCCLKNMILDYNNNRPHNKALHADEESRCLCPHYYNSDRCGYFREGRCEHPRKEQAVEADTESRCLVCGCEEGHIDNCRADIGDENHIA